MRRVEVVAPRSRAMALVRSLHGFGDLHLVPFEPAAVGPGAVVTEVADRIGLAPYRRLLDRAAALAGLLEAGDVGAERAARLWALDDTQLAAAVVALEPVGRRAGELVAEQHRLAGERARIATYVEIVAGLRTTLGRLPSLRGYASTAIVIQARYGAILALVRAELERMTGGRCELIAAEMGRERIAAILLYPASDAPAIRAMLAGHDLDEVALPAELAGLPLPELERRLVEEERRLELVDESVAGELAALRAANGPEAAALEAVLRDRVAEARALAAAGASDHLVVVSGWLPADRLPALRKRLTAEVGEATLVVDRAVGRAEQGSAPVAFANRAPLRAFESLASFVNVPRYGSLDPTPLLAITFPVFVGLMVGDAGYGLVLLALVIAAWRRWRRSPVMAVVGPIGVLAASATIVFGILFGEWFGDAGHLALGLEPVWFDRREAVLPFLVLALAIGVGQVALGLLLGIVNGALLGRRDEVVARAGLLAVLLAVVAGIGWLLGFLPDPAGQLALGALVAAVIVLVISLGVAGPVEAFGMLGNVLSYARLMAVGMASVMLAIVANRLGGLLENAVIGLLVAALLHTVNIALGFFDSSIQGLRLHYVEFFTKFVEPGGLRYQPFRSPIAGALAAPAATAQGD